MTDRAKKVRQEVIDRMPKSSRKIALIWDQAEAITHTEEDFAKCTLALASHDGPILSNAVWVAWGENGIEV